MRGVDVKEDDGRNRPAEKVSLCATVFNESDSIESWLDSIARQSRQPDELVICDAGSTDGTAGIIRSFEFDSVDVKVIVNEGANVPEGRNIAIAAAAFPLIAVTDAGTVLEPDWLECLVRPLESDSGAGVSAGFYRPAGRNFFEKVLATVITPRLRDVGDDGFPPSSRSVAFRREWWERVSGYPEWLRAGEDLVFDFALRDQGARFVFAHDAIVSWFPRPTLRAFFDQYAHYARGDGHGHLFTGRHLIRYSAYASGAGLAVAGRKSKFARLALVAGVAAHMKGFVGRVLDEKPYQSRAQAAVAIGLVPVIVVTGDVAKMTGYPKGLWERWRAGGPDGLKRVRIESHRSTAPEQGHRINGQADGSVPETGDPPEVGGRQ